ncbi:MAG: toxin HicA [Firmicutes bacterium]|nr:toxin HicA [Bacillota bacterium]
MSKKQKLLEKIKNNPQKIRFEEVDKLLLSIGFNKRQPRGGSSHFTYTLNDIIITIPYNKPYVKIKYIKDVIELLEKLDY